MDTIVRYLRANPRALRGARANPQSLLGHRSADDHILRLDNSVSFEAKIAKGGEGVLDMIRSS